MSEDFDIWSNYTLGFSSHYSTNIMKQYELAT